MCEIILDKVSVYYGNGAVLNNISLTIKKGEFAIIVGPNGAGKSTLVRVIAGLLAPQSGSVKINCQDVDNSRKQGLISYVPQNYEKSATGFPATVEEIVSLGLAGLPSKAKSKKNIKQIVNHMLNLVGVEPLKGRRFDELSGGQKQRVMVAKALAASPALLLLDEPTSGIDFKASSQIYEILGNLNKNLGVTIVMVSHDIDNAVGWAEKVICVNRNLCFCGSSQEFRYNHKNNKHLFL